jgi:YfiH family protein
MNVLKPNWPAPNAIKAYTTLRYPLSDSQDRIDNKKNENKLIAELNLPSPPIWLQQTHSALVTAAEPSSERMVADASFTSTPSRVCVVMTADCLPLFICNKRGTKIAAIHAGWRGLSSGVIEATLDSLSEKPDELLVWLGPAIGPKKFEVGDDVYHAFISRHLESAQAFSKFGENKWLADLYMLAKIRLTQHHVTHIYGGDFCTFTDEDRFFSYRRDKEQIGRMAHLIWIAS